MNCPNCGADNKNGVKFCKKCGSAINYDTKSKKSTGKIIAVVIAAVVALAIAAVVIFFTVFEGSTDNLPFVDNTESTAEETEAETEESTTQPTTTEPETTEPSSQKAIGAVVPDVIGLKYSDAYQKLDEFEFKCEAVYQYSDNVAKGYVISQYPAEGKTLDSGESVIVYVSTGTDTDVSSYVSGTSSGEYILYGSDSRYLDKSEITSLSKTDMELGLNEIYARHGRKFKTQSISDYFNSKSWYRGTVEPEDFSENIFNKYEKANRDLIVEVMEEKGYR